MKGGTSSNNEIVKRLQRAGGHLAKVIEMIDSGRSDRDVAQQMQAVAGAVLKAKNTYIREQIEKHIKDDVPSDMLKIEIQELSKYL